MYHKSLISFIMKKILLIIFLFSIQLYIYSQIGINTKVPQGVLHIDAKGDNPASGAPGTTVITDDILINNLGNLAIGHITPSHKLHIKSGTAGAIRIESGDEEDRKILVSDANGNAFWEFLGMPIVKGVLPTTGLTMAADKIPTASTSTNIFTPTGAYIDLPPGRWCVFVNFILPTSGSTTGNQQTERSWVRTTFSEKAAGGDFTTDIDMGSTWCSGLMYSYSFSNIQGLVTIYNSTSSTKRYYHVIYYMNGGRIPATISMSNFTSASNLENTITAVRVNDN